ncbi:glycoside hydrolase family 47 protein [Heterobasidion irregulare TC 32-1]|uniref:alpha-1,2-Mannosidase n=1 Tax=Heterobasidion irregulare (strain TC 32-1) TaxID=747525 RepID=W4KH61_HETIT|nr:glycoside hydrolase family 47 protein [Heterobasidion irregulare TC 32-1]ETW84376.1 glycoside hydrolase family 47 protein [Heterobasidion irregulare TC 32-1]
MNWLLRWPEIFLAVLFVALEAYRWGHASTPGLVRAQWTTSRKLDTRNKVRDLWYHGYNSYMRFAWPLDELSPLSCTGRGPDWDSPDNIAFNDVAGNFSLTLIDSLDTLVVLNDRRGFEDAVRKTMDWVSFDVNTKPQLFETNIRVLGGLLSAHIFASRRDQPFYLPWYHGELLSMAHDLGERFLSAFSTPTGIPYARTNLRHGVPRGESIESCSAGGGSLILEFATLSRLTGDDRFEKAARKAFFAIWNRKSDIGLVGNTINIWSGTWLYPEVSGIGAGIDSFFEYALKWYILSGDHEFLDVWNDSYAAIMRYARSADGLWYRRVNIQTGDVAYSTVDSLSAFWPGLQVLAGDVDNAIKSHMIYWQLWRKHSGLPEVWDMNYKTATSFQFPLRPEFVESTWYLYRATHDPLYLDIGERILYDITIRAKVECGLTGIRDLRDNQRDDRMESFVLSETLKYLYLLFDESNPLHTDDSNYVFTTEGHILLLGQEHLKPMSSAVRKLRRNESHQCPAYQPVSIGKEGLPGLTLGIYSRSDVDYTSYLIGMPPSDQDKDSWHPNGWCEVPQVDLFSYDFILSADGKLTVEDPSPGKEKIASVSDGFIVHNISGLRTRIVSRLDGRGYDVSKLGLHTIHSGQIVYINDTALALKPVAKSNKPDAGESHYPDVRLRFFVDFVDPMFQVQPGINEVATSVDVMGHTAMFGANPSKPPSLNSKPLKFGHGEGTNLVHDSNNPLGCLPYERSYSDEAILVHRGKCTFLEKLKIAHAAGALGVVVLTDNEIGINPSADEKDLEAVGSSLDDMVMVVLRKSDGRKVSIMMDLVDSQGLGRVVVSVESGVDTGRPPEWNDAHEEHQAKGAPPDRVLYLNGHPLLNTRLLV